MQTAIPTPTFSQISVRMLSVFFVLAVVAKTSVLLLILVAFGAPWWILFLSVIVGLAALWWARSRARDIALDIAEAQPADEHAQPRLFNLTAGISATMGISPTPQLFITKDAARNVAVIGSAPENYALVVTTGLVEALDVVESEAILGEALYRIRARLVAAPTLAVTTLCLPLVLGEWWDAHQRMSRALRGFRGPINVMRHRWFPPRQQIDIDIAAMTITRYPPALASALEEMNGRSVLVMGSPATEQLWLAPPTAQSMVRSSHATHLPLGDRISVLHEL